MPLNRASQVRYIRQSVSKDCLFSVIAQWCKSGAGKTQHNLQILSAFASGAGVHAITPLLDVFLADGNNVDIIVGIDHDGTDKGALKQLYSLAEAYHHQCNVWVFNAPSRSSIFHPKLYALRSPQGVSFVVGSANLTSSGLGTNFESLLLFEHGNKRSNEVIQVQKIWKLFAEPKSPLRSQYLRRLTESYLRKLLRRLPERSSHEVKSSRKAVRDLWRPLSQVSLPRSSGLGRRGRMRKSRPARVYLLMDILTETRKTQMQIPLPIVERFFRVSRDERAVLSVSIWTAAGLSQPINRNLVMSRGPARERLMRRLEMPPIKNLKRPLAVVFTRFGGKRQFAFHLIPRDSKDYPAVDRLLDRNGQQERGRRRYIIGRARPSDSGWPTIKKVLPKTTPLD